MHTLPSFQASLGYSTPITALAFDPVCDQIWTGDQQGIVAAFQGHSLARGVAFPACRPEYPPQTPGINKIVASNDVVNASSTQSGVGGWNKGGINKWYYPDVSTCTFTPTSSPSTSSLVSLSSSEILLLNTTTPTVNPVRQARTVSLASQLSYNPSYNSLAIAGCADGFVRTYDIRTALFRASISVSAHPGGISCLATSGNYIYTTGWGLRSGRPHPDPFVKVYDLRGSLRSLASLPFHGGPTFVAVHPSRPSMIYVVPGEGGFVQTADISDPTAGGQSIPIVSSSFITSFAISPSGTYLALGDTAGYVHLLSSATDEEERLPFNGFTGQEIIHPDIPEHLPEIQWTETTPLNSMGMPHYTTHLLSKDLPSPTSFPSNPLPKIPLQILNNLKLDANGMGSAALTSEMKGKRNMVAVRTTNGGTKGRFRSVKNTDEAETPIGTESPDTVPRKYRKVEIEYSKFGVDDFDFEFYNKTAHSGLETHILNSYTNSLVQVLFYAEPLRVLAKSHLTVQCPRENCLLCEFGFVARMLEDARGVNCQTSNFCRVIGSLPQAQAMGLVDYAEEASSHPVDYSSMIQTFNRFALEQFAAEITPFGGSILRDRNSSPDLDPVTQLVGLRARTTTTCTNCGIQNEKLEGTRIVDLVYTNKGMSSFAEVLEDSFVRETTYKSTCSICKGSGSGTPYRPGQCVFKVCRYIDQSALPAVLVVNAGSPNSESRSMWASKTPPFVQSAGISLNGCQYNIRSMVVEVDEKGKSPHLVALVRLPGIGGQSDLWFMFNDFVVKEIDESEALDFSMTWKSPAIVFLERVDLDHVVDTSSLPMRLNTDILSQDISMSPNRDRNLLRHIPFDSNDIPTPGTLISIDAEFVQMQQEEVEYRADGSKKVLRPSRLSLARVSVVRGQGQLQGTPCIDDHIHTSEMIVNYLTEFSGIKFGDLDPHISRHTLVPLKVAYKKLRVLVDLGCVFIGHGLLKDFRIINIFVPRDQVIDTVDLYFLPERQRRLSLRFLTWFILKEDIQQDTHDSIEDAVSALRLYNAYEDFEERGVVDEKLAEAYKIGKQNNWKPPSDRQNTFSPPIPASAPPASLSFPGSLSRHSTFQRTDSSSTPPTFTTIRHHLQFSGRDRHQEQTHANNYYTPPRPSMPDQLHGNLSWRRQK